MPAKPNYGFEKRQRELEKKRKKAEKADQKRFAPTGQQPSEGGGDPNQQAGAGQEPNRG